MARALADLPAVVMDASPPEASRHLCEQATALLGLAGADILVAAAARATGGLAVEATFGVRGVAGLTGRQVELDEGPCIDACRRRGDVVEPRLPEGGARWPAFTDAAVGAGVRGVYSYYLGSAEHPLGVLTLFAEQPEQLNEEGRTTARVLAQYASLCLANRTNQTAADLPMTRSRDPRVDRSVDQAVGLIAVEHDLTGNDAVVTPARCARRLGIAERDLAHQLVLTHRDMNKGGHGEAVGVLVVDGQASYREALGRVLRHEPGLMLAGDAATAPAAVEAARVSPDVALLAFDTEPDDVEALRSLHDDVPDLPVVVLTADEDEERWGRAVQAGASAALAKTASLGQVLDVTRRVGRGESVLTGPDVARWMRAAAARRERSWQARMLERAITAREREVLGALARGGDNEVIAEELGIAAATVQTHVRNLLGKFDVSRRIELLVVALRLGLVDTPT